MHQKISAKIDGIFPSGDQDEILCEVIIVTKNITPPAIRRALTNFLANTNFSEHLLYNFESEVDDQNIKEWLSNCEIEHPELKADDPFGHEHLEAGTFHSDRKNDNHATLYLVYERRYLENE